MRIVNNKQEFGAYLIEVYGWEDVRSGLDDLISHEAEEGCSMRESVRQGCEQYWEGELLENQEAGLVKFNLPKKDMLDVLEKISRE